MKRKLLALLAILTVLSATLCLITGCTDASEKQTSVRNPELLQNAPEFITKQLVDFSSDVSNILYIPDGYSNGTPFGVVWNKNNVNFDKETKTMELSLTKGEDKYYGCEVKTYGEAGYVQYGYFGCKMKPSNVVGTASTFFTYTGESDGNPHDEIDIEFLGKDTTRVQFNYFVDGQGGNEYWFDLGFDASEEYHNYGFFWDENRIIWYVDFVPVYAVSGKVPSHPQRVFTNFWAGDKNASDIIAWMGDLSDEDLPAKTCYQDVSVAYLNGWGIELPKGEFIPDVSEFKSSTIELNKGSQDIYTVTTSADKTENTITYTAVQPKSYRNVYGYVDDNVKNSKYIAAKLKNNGEDEVQVRVDIISETVNAAGIQVINTKAWMDGKVVKTDLKYGGSFFTIKGNSEVVCVVEFYGIPSRFMLMCDSFRSGDDTFAGSVTVSDFMYYGENDYVEERVSLDTGYVLLAPGATVQLNATSTGEVVWSVDNPNVATVVDGLVTAVSEGTTSVRATTGSAVALCTIKVTTKSPKEEETLEIVSEDEDLAHKSNITGGVTAKGKQETENTYNNSTEAVALSGAISGESLIFSTLSTWELTSEGYFEFFLRNVGHVPSSNGETINGFYLALTLNGSVVSKEEVKTYKNYNLNCRTSAGNDWYKWTIPFSLFSTAEGTQFNGIKMKVYAAMSSGEYLYIDGIKLSSKAAEGGNTTEIDHSKETLPICDEAVDLLKKENSHWIKGGYQIETVNTYGTSTKAFAWSGCAHSMTI